PGGPGRRPSRPRPAPDAARAPRRRQGPLLPPRRREAHQGADLMLIGAHVPTSGGVPMAPGNGRSIEASAIQIFTRSQRQWKAKPMSGQESGAFRSALGGSGVKAVLAHASYLINLSSIVPQFLALSRKTLA